MGHDSGTLEKIICCDRGDNDAALIAAMNSNRHDDYSAWMNNPFAYLMFLAFAR